MNYGGYVEFLEKIKLGLVVAVIVILMQLGAVGIGKIISYYTENTPPSKTIYI